MLKVIDGLRTTNHANAIVDIASQSTNGTQVNATSVDMANHAELLYFGFATAITGTGVATYQVQESNESGANFTNVTNAAVAVSAVNTVKIGSVDWRKGVRKRYARMVVNTTNAVTVFGFTARVQPLNVITLGNNVVQTDS